MTTTTFPKVLDWETETVCWNDTEIAVDKDAIKEPLVQHIARTAMDYETATEQLLDALADVARYAESMRSEVSRGFETSDWLTSSTSGVTEYTVRRRMLASELTALVRIYERG